MNALSQTRGIMSRSRPAAVQLLGGRAAGFRGKTRVLAPHNLDLSTRARRCGAQVVCPRAAATLTPASVVTSHPDVKDIERLEATLGPLGKDLVQQVEVRVLYGATTCIALLQQILNSKPLVLPLCAAGILSMCRDRNSHPLFCRHRDKAMRRSQALLTEGTSSCTRLLTCGQTTSLMFQEHAVLNPSACTMLQCYFHLATCMHDPCIFKFSNRLLKASFVQVQLLICIVRGTIAYACDTTQFVKGSTPCC